MRALLLPIKDLRRAKQRLAGALSPDERSALAEAMLSDVFRAIRGARNIEKIFVVTNYEPAMEIAAEQRWDVLREERQVSESASVDFASRLCEERGVTSLLRLPLDLPLIEAADIEDLLAIECPAPAAVIVPSRDETGTNAILREPPTLFPSQFGPGSFAKHRRAAESRGAVFLVHRNHRLEIDIDDEADLRELLRLDLTHTATGRWLEESGVAERFRGRAIGA